MSTELSTSTRDRILVAAIRIIRDRGADALTVRTVAAEADCSTIGVYTHFTDKAGLVEAVILEAFDEFAAALATSDEVADGRQRLLTSARAYRLWALRNPTRYLLMFTPLIPGFTPRPGVIERNQRVLRAHRDRVAHAMATGALADADADEIARHLWAAVHGHVSLDLLTGRSFDDTEAQQQYDRAMASVIRGLA